VVVALPDRVHILVHVPASVPRAAVTSRLQRHVADALSAANMVQPGVPVWQQPGWCAVLASLAALVAVRRHLTRRVAPLVREQLPGRRDDIGRLRQDVVLERGSVW